MSLPAIPVPDSESNRPPFSLSYTVWSSCVSVFAQGLSTAGLLTDKACMPAPYEGFSLSLAS